MTTKAAQKRYDFITEVFAASNEKALAAARGEDVAPMTDNDWAAIVDRCAEEGPALGRTERWQAACTWALEIMGEAPEEAGGYRWAALQGAVYMGYAAE